MNRLREIISSPEQLHDGLRENALHHRSYNRYLPMEAAMCLCLTGSLYLSNGQKWNDKEDRKLMKQYQAFGISFACSTAESMAMWMLYSGNRAEKGAMIKFIPSVIKDILNVKTVELCGSSDEVGGAREKTELLFRETGDFEIYMTDVLYVDAKEDLSAPSAPRRIRATLREDHQVLALDLIRNANIFYKNFAWSSERECRLIVTLSNSAADIAEKKGFSAVKIQLPQRDRTKIRKNTVQSPLYGSNFAFGKESILKNKVEW